MLQMTDEQRYSAVLKELGEVLQEKSTTISCQKWQIDQLKEKLEQAEAERDRLANELHIANEQFFAMAEQINALKGGAA